MHGIHLEKRRCCVKCMSVRLSDAATCMRLRAAIEYVSSSCRRFQKKGSSMDVIEIALSVLSAMLLYASLGILAPPAFRKICTQAASLPHPIDAHERVRIVEDNREALVVGLQIIGAAANRRLRHAGLFSTLSYTSIHSWKRHSTLPRAHSRPSACACCTTRAGRRTRHRRSGTCSTGSRAKGACKRGFAHESSSGRCAT